VEHWGTTPLKGVANHLEIHSSSMRVILPN